MTNREWLLNKMQNMSDEEFGEEFGKFIIRKFEVCKIMKEKCPKNDCCDCVKYFLQMEHKEKITLSEAERVILENIDKDYEIISKTKNGSLFVQKANGMRYFFDVFDKKIFDFIVNERFYNISELLKGE